MAYIKVRGFGRFEPLSGGRTDPAMPAAQPAFYGNITLGGGPAPVRAYIKELLRDILEGRIQPGRVFDREVNLDGVSNGYREMPSASRSRFWCDPNRRQR